jgi:hypothetical protein
MSVRVFIDRKFILHIKSNQSLKVEMILKKIRFNPCWFSQKSKMVKELL